MRPLRHGWSLLLLLTSLAGWIACAEDSERDKVPFRAPLWGEPPRERLLLRAPALDLAGDQREIDLGQHPAHAFLVYGGARTTLTLDLEDQRSGADPVLILYGPRTQGDIWGRAQRMNDDGGQGNNARLAHIPLGELGEYLVVATTYDRSTAGALRLTLRCESGCEGILPCPDLDCIDPDACYRGYATDARGCQVCACLDECRDDSGCGASQVCVDGECRPDCACFDEVATVCGDDGRSYPNACEARCAGVSIAANGPCEDTCPDDGCQTNPCDLCEDLVQPVCTLNGLTLTNACQARCIGEQIAYPGRCDRACPPMACGLSCPDGFARDRDGCAVCECAPRVCDPLDAPECGVNGVTYANACERERAGVELAFRETCPPTCLLDDHCPQGLTCRPLAAEGSLACPEDTPSDACPGKCVLPEDLPCLDDDACPLGALCQDGTCQVCPRCSPVYQPVCDDQGRTALNVCHAQRCAEAQRWRAGACCDPAALDGCDLQCDNGLAVDGDGCAVCACLQAPPCACQDTNNPVCGQDNTTWNNLCEARCAGVGALADGPCPAP